MKKMGDIDNRYLRPDGSNLAAFLYLLKLKHETSYSLIRRTVQRVAPFFDDFLLEPLRLNCRTKFAWSGATRGRTPISMPQRFLTAHCGLWPWRRCCCNLKNIVLR